jgi:hypothetical protein
MVEGDEPGKTTAKIVLFAEKTEDDQLREDKEIGK